jgi:hypothetical protein
MAKGPRRGRGESPTEKFLRLEKSGASLVNVNVGRLRRDDDVPEQEPTNPSPAPAEHEPDADRH